MEAEEWSRRQARAKDEIYDLINKGGTDNLLKAIDLSWVEYCHFTGPVMMSGGRKAERLYTGLSEFAKRMVIDSACALAYERSKST